MRTLSFIPLNEYCIVLLLLHCMLHTVNCYNQHEAESDTSNHM